MLADWRSWLLTGIALCALVLPASASAGTEMDAGAMSHGRYAGAPDLTLTSSMIAAGGGVRAFDSMRLLSVLCAQHTGVEVAGLRRRYGAERVSRFVHTFNAFAGLAVQDAATHHIALPAPQLGLEHNSYLLAASLRRSGVMPDGRYDVGYMLEHLFSRPMHVRLMNAANASPAVGPDANADFHIILTAAMDDLKTLYTLPK